MNAAIKRKWVKALRSGDYKQGFGRLRSKKDCFCVLGVLCNLHAQANPGIAVSQKKKWEYLGQGYSLPWQVGAWAEVSINPWVKQGDYSHSLVELNDQKKLSFNELADIIEAQL